MNFLTLPYNCVTISFLPEIWFWGPTHPTFLYDVTLFSLFLLKASLSNNLLQLRTCSRRGGQQLERGQSPLLVTEASDVVAGVLHVRDARDVVIVSCTLFATI